MHAPVLLLEFNELCPDLLDRFIDAGHLPHFQKLRQQSQKHITSPDGGLEDLEPWIQWVSVHTGLSASQHGLKRLDEGHLCQKDRLWDIVARQQGHSLIFSSMNISYKEPAGKDVMLPDPWAEQVNQYPPGEFDDFVDFVVPAIREHTNATARSGPRSTLRFIRFLLTHGLTLATARRLAAQILLEKRTGRYGWRRSFCLDHILLDTFLWYYRKRRPAFATLFLNSVAHAQHVYWRHMDPRPFRKKPDSAARAEYADAILLAYRNTDAVLGRIMGAIGDSRLVLCSALSQQPCLDYESSAGKRFYRPADINRLVDLLPTGIGPDWMQLRISLILVPFYPLKSIT